MRLYLSFFSILFLCNCSNESRSAESMVANVFNTDIENEAVADAVYYKKLALKGQSAYEFCKTKKFNQEFCILIDMSKHSGLNRFYVWQFATDTFAAAFPVSHGCCDNYWNEDFSKDNPVFSNQDGSHCTSLGKYKMGERGYSNWGIHIKYLMHGLETSNSNALARQIVFHGWENVPDEEVFPNGTPEGWGCPAISNKNMRLMDSLLKDSKQPVLMWIYQD